MKRLIPWLLVLAGGYALAQSPGTPITSLPQPIPSTYLGSEIIPGVQVGAGSGCSGGYCGVGFLLSNLKTYFGTPAGAVTVTGFPIAGQLTAFSSPTSITGGNLFGDCTTSSTLAVICLRTNGVLFAASATVDATNATNIVSGTLSNARLNATIASNTTGTAAAASALAASPSQCTGSQFAQGINASGNANCATPAGSGNISGSGSPASGHIAGFTSSTTISNIDLSGDCATSGSAVTACTKTGGVAFGTLATASAASPPALGTGTPNTGAFTALTVNGQPVGYLNFPMTGGAVKTANYTFALGDASTRAIFNCSGACTLTIPANASVAYPIGTILGAHVICAGSNNLTVAITTDTMYLSPTPSATGSRTVSICGEFVAEKETATSWDVSGAGTF